MDIKALQAIVKTIKALTMDAVEKAQSGHPGLPMGCAEIGSYLYAEILNLYPIDPHWVNRDRFILSAGHGSMLLYSLMFLSGYNISLDDIKNFRQLKSKTPGHPEYGWTEGVETTTGPLGQGFGNAVGMALGGKILSQKYNRPNYEIFNNKIYTLVGDGDLMEGISYEVASLAGHLKLNNLVVIYDKNNISIEGSTDITFTENVSKRFLAMNWDVFEIDGNDLNSIKKAFDKISTVQDKPTILVAKTTIANGSVTKAGKNISHGAPLGAEDIKQTKEALHIPCDFFVDELAIKYFAQKNKEWETNYEKWNLLFKEWSVKYPDLYKEYQQNSKLIIPEQNLNRLEDIDFNPGDMLATRNASNYILNKIVKDLDFVVSGSADLASSTKTTIKDSDIISRDNYLERNIQYGIREHAMGAIANGLYLYGNILPVIGTFLSFMPYMKPAMRMAALMRIPIIYLFSHDSIYVGEDGPTHQPIEHISLLRLLPNFNTMRPADAYETKIAWKIALSSTHTPSAIITTRQNVQVLNYDELGDYKEAEKGAYIIKKEQNKIIDLIIITSGSEVSITLQAVKNLEKEGFSIRVISMFSMFLFDKQDKSYKEDILPSNVTNRLSIEAGASSCWYKYIGLNGKCIAIDRFGISGKAKDLGKYFGFTPENIYTVAKSMVNENVSV